MSRSQLSAKNLISVIFKSFFTIMFGIVTTPYLLSWLGDDIYGTFKIISDIFFNLGIFELGLTGTIIGLMSKAFSKNDLDGVREIIGSSQKAFLSVLPVVIIVCAVILYKIDFLTHFSSISLHDIRVSFFIICLGLLYLPAIPYRTYLQVIHRGDVVNWIVLFQLVLTTLLSLVAAYIDLGLVGQAVAFTFSILIGSSAFFISYKVFFRLKLQLVKRTSPSHELWKVNWEYFIVNFANKISFYFDNIVIGFFMGPKIVVVFFLTQKLPLLIQHNLGSLGNSVWAPIVVDFHKGNIDKFKSNVLQTNKILSLVSMATILPVMIYNRDFIRLWIGEEYFVGMNVTILSCVVAYFHSLVGFWGWVMTSCGMIRQQVKPFVVNAVVNLTISLILVNLIGLQGPIVGTIIGLLFVIIPINVWYLSKALNASIMEFLKPILQTLLMGLVFVYVFFKIDANFMHFGWPLLLTSMTLVFMAYCLACWILIFSNQEKQIWKTRIIGLFHNDPT